MKPTLIYRELYLDVKRYKTCYSKEETLNIADLDFKSLAIIIPCGLIALFGIYKILRQSISLVFWIALVVIGALGVGYVLKPDITSQVVHKIKSGEINNIVSEEQSNTHH